MKTKSEQKMLKSDLIPRKSNLQVEPMQTFIALHQKSNYLSSFFSFVVDLQL